MAERYDVKKLDGQQFTFHLPEGAGGCLKCMFGCFTCCTYSGQGTIKVIDDNTMQMHSMSFAGGLIRPSPIPCCMCCGFGPLAVVAPMARDETDPSRKRGVEYVDLDNEPATKRGREGAPVVVGDDPEEMDLRGEAWQRPWREWREAAAQRGRNVKQRTR